MATLAADACRVPSIYEIFDPLVTTVAFEARSAPCLLIGPKDGKILDLVATGCTTVSTVIACNRPIPKKENIGISIQWIITFNTTKVVRVPSIAPCSLISFNPGCGEERVSLTRFQYLTTPFARIRFIILNGVYSHRTFDQKQCMSRQRWPCQIYLVARPSLRGTPRIEDLSFRHSEIDHGYV